MGGLTSPDGAMNWMAFAERVAPLLAAESEEEDSGSSSEVRTYYQRDPGTNCMKSYGLPVY